MKRKKVRGSLTIEAIVAVPLFVVVFVAVIFSMRLYVIQGIIHTASISAMEQVNRASQLIFASGLDNKPVGELTDKNISDFSLLSRGKIDPYGTEAKDIFSCMPGLNTDNKKRLYGQVLYDSISIAIKDFVSDQLPGDYDSSFSLNIDDVSLSTDAYGQKISCDYTYTVRYPLQILNNGMMTKTVHLSTYLD